MILPAVIATGALLTTGCSTCCKKDGSCSKPMTKASCTNAFGSELVMGIMACTNQVSCTNAVNADLVAAGLHESLDQREGLKILTDREQRRGRIIFATAIFCRGRR